MAIPEFVYVVVDEAFAGVIAEVQDGGDAAENVAIKHGVLVKE